MSETKLVKDYKGLNLATAEQAVGFEYATSLNNMDFPQSGGMRGRGGFPSFSVTTTAAGISYLLWRQTAGRLLAIGPGEINAYNSSTGAKSVPTGAPTWAATSVSPPAVVGDPTLKQWVYVASVNAGAGVQLRRYEDNPGPNVVGNAPVASKPMFVAPYPGQNRLVYAGFFAVADAPGGANGDPSTLFFSDEFAPDTVGATHFNRLDPGDGEFITAVLGWQNQLFVFKNTKMYVFYGVSPDDDGEPIFNFRSFTLPDPIPATAAPWSWVPAAAGPDGVYFHGSSGLWRTQGSAPTRVKTTVDPIFANQSALAGSRAPNVHGEVRMGFSGPSLYMRYIGNTGSNLTLVWNSVLNTWSSWAFASGSFDTTPLITKDGTFVGYTQSAVVGNIGRFSQTLAVDGNNNVTYDYVSGYDDLGSGGEKRLRWIDVYGQNIIVTSAFAKGRRALVPVEAQASGGSITISSSGDTERARYKTPLRGRVFRFELSSSGGGANIASVERVEIHYTQGTNE